MTRFLLFALLLGCAEQPNPPSQASSSALVTESVPQEPGEQTPTDHADSLRQSRSTYAEWIVSRFWDGLVEARTTQADKFGVIADLSVSEVVLGKLSETLRYPHSIEAFSFVPGGRRLDSKAWRSLLLGLKGQGYEIVQTQWHHQSYHDAETPYSSVRCVLHINNARIQERIVVDAVVSVTWSSDTRLSTKLSPQVVTVTQAQLWIRKGPVAFEEVQLAEGKRFSRTQPLLLADLNGDGLSEIISGGSNRVFRNQGGFQFESRTFLAHPVQAGGVGVLADFNGDAALDYVTTQKETGSMLLYGGAAGGVFTTEPKPTSLSPALVFAQSVTAGDVDRDGDLDVFLAQNKSLLSEGKLPRSYDNATDGHPWFLLDNINGAQFVDVTAERGLASKQKRRVSGAVLVDLDHDKDLDLLTVSDFAGLDLFENDGGGRFKDVTLTRVSEPKNFGSSVTFADYNLDGQSDLYLVGKAATQAQYLRALQGQRSTALYRLGFTASDTWGNRMYLADSERFVEPTFQSSVSQTGWSWGTASFDFDNDGDPDVYVANGHTSGQSTRQDCWRHECSGQFDSTVRPYAERIQDLAKAYSGTLKQPGSLAGYQKNVLWMNHEGRHFFDVAFLMGVAAEYDTRAVVADDLDADGRVDLVLVDVGPQKDERIRVYRNATPNVGHWIGVRLRDEGPGYQTVGTKVTVRAGDRTWVKRVVVGDSLFSQHAATVHFGLGELTQVDEIEVTWPVGQSRRITRPPIDRYHAARAKPSQVYSQGPTAEQLQADRDRMDQTVWKKEVQSHPYEAELVKLWDRLNKERKKTAGDTLGILQEVLLTSIAIGRPTKTVHHPHEIEEVKLSGPGKRLSRTSWVEWLNQFKTMGFRLVQSEWHHARFDALPEGGARSEVTVELHLQAKEHRVIVRGPLGITWKSGEFIRPQHVDATRLTLFHRKGERAFEPVSLPTDAKLADRRTVTPLILRDLNADGLSEIIVAGGNQVFWNQGKMGFQLRPMVDQPAPLWQPGVVADFNGDAVLDFAGAGRDTLDLVFYSGDKEKGFISSYSPVERPSGPLRHPQSITAGDVDGDGDLDLFIAQYRKPYIDGQVPTPFYDANDGYPAFLMLNNGNGTFADATVARGLSEKRKRRSFGSTFVDLDDDHDLDLLVVSDYAGVELYTNDGGGYFKEATQRMLDEWHNFGMSVTFGDYDLDGQMDFYLSGMASTTVRRLEHLGIGREDHPEITKMRATMGYGSRMYLRQKDRYVEPSFRDDVARTGWSWGSSTFDFDNDADPDIYVGNGHFTGDSATDYCWQFWAHDVYITGSEPNAARSELFRRLFSRKGTTSWDGYQKNKLLMNRNGQGFVDVAFLMGLAAEYDSRGIVTDDLDGDGRVDVVVVEERSDQTETLYVYRNRLKTDNHWIGVRVISSSEKSSPLGAKVVLRTRAGKRISQLVTGDSLNAQHATSVHFGLGAVDQVKSLEVISVSGKSTQIRSPKVDRYHTVAVTF